MGSQAQQGPDQQTYEILVRTSDRGLTKTIELTRDEFVRLEQDLSAIRNGAPRSNDIRALADVRLIQHQAGYGGKAERVPLADLLRCLEGNSYLRSDVLDFLRDVTRAAGPKLNS